MTAASHPAPARHAVGIAALWFGLGAAPLAWSVQELASYAVVTHSCYPSWEPRYLPSGSGTWLIALVISLLALALGVAGIVTAYRSWQRTRAESEGDTHHHLEVGEGRTRFMAMSGIIVSSIMLLNIIMNGISLFLVQAC